MIADKLCVCVCGFYKQYNEAAIWALSFEVMQYTSEFKRWKMCPICD